MVALSAVSSLALASAQAPQDIVLQAGDSTQIVTEYQTFNVSCSGSSATIVRSDCVCEGVGYPHLSLQTLLSNGQLSSSNIGQYSSMEECDAKRQEYGQTLCKPVNSVP